MKDRFQDMGYYCVEDLVGEDPEIIRQKDCYFQNKYGGRRALSVFQIAVAFAEGMNKSA